MQWTVVADVLKALAAGVTAVIAALKFINDIRHKREQAGNEIASNEAPTLELESPTDEETDVD